MSQRTLFDLEMMGELGYCNGIENYSRHLSGRKKGEPPPTLIDYFPKDFLMVIDESADDVNVAGCCATLSNANATIKIPVAGSSASDTLQVILPTVTNPATPAAGARRLSVTTSADSLGTLSGLY